MLSPHKALNLQATLKYYLVATKVKHGKKNLFYIIISDYKINLHILKTFILFLIFNFNRKLIHTLVQDN